jgi:murein DD-endopeptidase MepM/ murein hydrolase activator NlpD
MEKARRRAFAISSFLVVLLLGISATFLAISFNNGGGGIPVINEPGIDNPGGDNPGGGGNVPAPVAFSVPVAGSEWTVLKDADMETLQRNATLKRWELHPSYDIGADPGTAVVAAYGGRVTQVSTGNIFTGTQITIEHDNGLKTVYGSLDNVAVNEGDLVTKGQRIATVGSTAGQETYGTDYVRFEAYKNNVQINPNEYVAEFASAK